MTVMTIKQEIDFWLKARNLIKINYGCRCKSKDFEPLCVECQAGLVIGFIDKHLDLLEDEQKIYNKRFGKKKRI